MITQKNLVLARMNQEVNHLQVVDQDPQVVARVQEVEVVHHHPSHLQVVQ
jgi:hypothetical protein